MSLVGTRPPTLDEWEKYEPHHRARMSFRPGLTGLWQVSGRSNITDFEEVVKLDTQYIREWSVKGDITMMTYTIRMTALHTSKMFILKERMIDIYPVWSIFLPSSCYQDVQHWSAETAAERLVHYSLMMSSISLYTFSTWDYILKP